MLELVLLDLAKLYFLFLLFYKKKKKKKNEIEKL